MCLPLPVISDTCLQQRWRLPGKKISLELILKNNLIFFFPIILFYHVFGPLRGWYWYTIANRNSTLNNWPDWEPCLTRQRKETHTGLKLFKDMVSACFSLHLRSKRDKYFFVEKNPTTYLRVLNSKTRRRCLPGFHLLLVFKMGLVAIVCSQAQQRELSSSSGWARLLHASQLPQSSGIATLPPNPACLDII